MLPAINYQRSTINFFKEMPAYVIVDINIHDPVGYEDYKKQAGATVFKYGGKYRSRRQDRGAGRRFATTTSRYSGVSVNRTREGLAEQRGYREPRKLRHKTSKTNMIVVEGLDEPLK
jgi:uncharacterized protein (DUF1330 family)